MKIVSDKPIRVATVHGAIVLFEPGEPKEIADEIGLIALQMGAKQITDGTAVEEAEPEVEEVEEDDDSDEGLVEALKKLIEEADPNSFKVDGTPKAAAVNKMLGRTVRTDEREAAWEIALNA